MSNNHKADTMLEIAKADIPAGDTVETLGFASKSDGGGAKYVVVAPSDKEYCMVTESVSRKEMEAMYPELDEPDITITKEQAVLMLNIINHFEGQQDCLDKNEEVLKAYLEGVI